MDEIAALREEMAKLRERIAVLEARPQSWIPSQLQQWPQYSVRSPTSVTQLGYPPLGPITHGSGTAC